jgi:hypothetical protein
MKYEYEYYKILGKPFICIKMNNESKVNNKYIIPITEDEYNELVILYEL